MVSIPVYAVILILAIPFVSRRKMLWLVRRIIGWWAYVVIKFLPWPLVKVCYTDFAGKEEKGPFIFVCNHKSFSDGFLVAYIACEGVEVVNQWPFRIPVIGIVAKLAGYINVKDMPYDEFAVRIKELLDQGVSVVVFPEGTRSESGVMGQFHSSVFRIAQESGYPIVPFCISGNVDMPRKGSLVLRPGRIDIHRLEAINSGDYREMLPFKFKNMVREVIRVRLERMTKEKD